ncbi:MAG: hypothetical protein M1833_000463 [Piccolia ochrophora]|nr:MAG: hypothetical protein M1833_000463 [Piccolia ochrophora]
MESARGVFFILLILFLFLSPDTQPPSVNQRHEASRLVDQEKHGLGVLTRSAYGKFDTTTGGWLNLTGLREEDGYAWEGLSTVKKAASEDVLVLGGGGRDLLEGIADSAVEVSTPKGETDDESLLSQRLMPVYQNVTGLIRGHWARSKLSAALRKPELNLTAIAPNTAYATHEYDRNITGHEGKIQIKLSEKAGEQIEEKTGAVRDISATMSIKDETSSGDGWDITLHGVHFPNFGGVILTTTSQKYDGLFALPAFALSNHTHSLAQSLLNTTLSANILAQERHSMSATVRPWSSAATASSDVMFPTPHCEFIVYLQQHPVDLLPNAITLSTTTNDLLRQVEEELRFPDGAPVPDAPPMIMSMKLYSPDCGFILESKGPPRFAPQDGVHLQGPKVEAYISRARHYSMIFTIICAAQVLLTVRQMQEASTPSTVSRISFWTVAMLAFGDGLIYIAFLSGSMFVDTAFLTLITTGFIAFVNVNFLGMRLMMDIWTVQAPERREREQQESSASTNDPGDGGRPAPTAAATPAETDTLPTPVSARPADNSVATPVILPPDQDLAAAETDDAENTQTATQQTGATTRRDLGTFYSRFYLLLLGVMFLSIYATSWPTTIRSAYTNILAFVYFSFWTPQIYRNVMRNCRQALRWEYVIGHSIFRLVPVIYLYTVADNVLFVETDPNAALALVAWVWVQILCLASGAVLGPRFLLPSSASWIPPAYDYHPVLREDDLEAGSNMPLGLSPAPSVAHNRTSSSTSRNTGAESVDKGRWVFDCAICMQSIDVPVVPSRGAAGDSSAGLSGVLLGRRSYMVTPCRHIFHS